MTVSMQGQFSELDVQVGSTVFATDFYASESSFFEIILMRQKK